MALVVPRHAAVAEHSEDDNADQAGCTCEFTLLPSIEGRFFTQAVEIGVLSRVALALRPGFSAQARKPPMAHRASRGGRRGLLVLIAGSGGGHFYRRYSTVSVASSLPDVRLRFTLFLGAALHRGTEGLRVVTSTESDQEARSQSELARGWKGRRLSLAIDARRHLSGLVTDRPGPRQVRALRGDPLERFKRPPNRLSIQTKEPV